MRVEEREQFSIKISTVFSVVIIGAWLVYATYHVLLYRSRRGRDTNNMLHMRQESAISLRRQVESSERLNENLKTDAPDTDFLEEQFRKKLGVVNENTETTLIVPND